MPGYSKITLILKDSPMHTEYNKRLMDYLNDRHMAINDNMITIAIEVADESNINEYAIGGMESIPALKQDDTFVYGVNSILSTLAKLEKVSTATRTAKQDNFSNAQNLEPSDQDTSQFYNMVMEEMKSDEQEDPDSPSTVKAYHQDLPESPLTDKAIEEKAKAYSKIYEQRNKQSSNRAPPPKSRRDANASTNVDVDNFIAKGGYDKGEELFMRQIAQNLN